MQSTSNEDLRLVELHFSSLREMRTVLANHVSAEGLFLEGEVSFEISELLRIRAVLPEDFVLFEAVGVVLWVDRLPQEDGNGPLGTAVRWVTLDEKGRTVVEDLVGGIPTHQGGAFELTPHGDHGEQMPSDAFDATPARPDGENSESQTRFKFMVRGGQAAAAGDGTDSQSMSMGLAAQESVEGFDPEASLPPTEPMSAPVWAPESELADASRGPDELEWIEPDANPLPVGSSGSSEAMFGDLSSDAGPMAPVLSEVDLPDVEPVADAVDVSSSETFELEAASGALDEPSSEALELEAAARALDHETAADPAVASTWAPVIEIAEPVPSALPPMDTTMPIPPEAIVETTVPMDIPVGGSGDISTVFDGLAEGSDASAAPMPEQPPEPRRGGWLGLLLGILGLVVIVAGGWFWWDSQGGRTGIPAVDGAFGWSSSPETVAASEGNPEVAAADPQAGEVTTRAGENRSDPGDPPEGLQESPAATQVPTMAPTAVPTAVPTVASEAGQRGVRPTAPVPAEPTNAVRIGNIRAEVANGGMDVVLTPDAGRLAADRLRTEELRSPRRVLIRILGIHEGFRPFEIPVSGGDVQGLRIGFHPEGSRPELWVVADLASESNLTVREVVADGNELRIRLR